MWKERRYGSWRKGKMDFMKRLLGIETDSEWVTKQPIGLGGEGYANWDMSTSTLLGRRQWSSHAEYNEATVEEIWKTKKGNLVHTQVCRYDKDTHVGQMTESQAYGFLLSYNLTSEGHAFMREFREGLPEL
jgi:hypothetical protein